jgi:hypothetical protein
MGNEIENYHGGKQDEAKHEKKEKKKKNRHERIEDLNF